MPLPYRRLTHALATAAACTLASAAALAQVPDQSPVPIEDEQLATPQDDLLRVVLETKAADGIRRVGDVRVAVFDEPTGALVSVGHTDEYGTLTVDVPFHGRYRMESCAPNYLAKTVVLSDCGSDGENKLMCVEGMDFFAYDDARTSTGVDHILIGELYLDSLAVGEVIDLDKIYYDYDKATLRPESKRELDRLVAALEQLPGLDIQLRSHTDSRGTDAYNQDLSQRRAQSVVDYLIASGIASARFTAKGFGESQLLNECADGVECSSQKHQRNRRTEFEIKAYEPAACPELPEIVER